MAHPNDRRALGFALLAALAWCGAADAQEAPAPNPPPPAPTSPLPEVTQKSPVANCVEPPPVISLEDYHGAVAKFVGLFATKLEYKSVHAPHYKSGAVLCVLPLDQKFVLFARQTLTPATFLIAGFGAGIDQARDADPSYGQGAAGYGKRFGANLADQASNNFFKTLVYPTIFSEDPRYYRLGQGPGGKRFLHALEHSVVAHRDNGARMFNFSEWLGTSSAVALSNVYHPDYERGWGPGAARVAIGVARDAGIDVLREFWPEIARELHLPYRGEPSPSAPAPKN